MVSVNPKARHGARKAALQAIYQHQLTKRPILEIMAEVLADPHTRMLDIEYFRKLAQGIVSNMEEIDGIITPVADRALIDITPLELTMLRLAIYELRYCISTPYRVVLNEAIELAKRYGAEDSHKYINGVLDKVVAQLRPIEVQQHRG